MKWVGAFGWLDKVWDLWCSVSFEDRWTAVLLLGAFLGLAFLLVRAW